LISLKKFWGQKRAKFGAISDDLKLGRQISLKRNRIKIFKIRQALLIDRDFFPLWQKMSGELWSSKYGDLMVKSYTHRNRVFWSTIFRPLRSVAPANFYTRYKIIKFC